MIVSKSRRDKKPNDFPSCSDVNCFSGSVIKHTRTRFFNLFPAFINNGLDLFIRSLIQQIQELIISKRFCMTNILILYIVHVRYMARFEKFFSHFLLLHDALLARLNFRSRSFIVFTGSGSWFFRITIWHIWAELIYFHFAVWLRNNLITCDTCRARTFLTVTKVRLARISAPDFSLQADRFVPFDCFPFPGKSYERFPPIAPQTKGPAMAITALWSAPFCSHTNKTKISTELVSGSNSPFTSRFKYCTQNCSKYEGKKTLKCILAVKKILYKMPVFTGRSTTLCPLLCQFFS